MSTSKESTQLWQEASELAEYIYGKLHEMPDDEKWFSAAKLRTAAIDMLFFVSEAEGNASPSGHEYDWGQARKATSALKAMYRFVCRRKFLEVEPSIMVRFDELLKAIDAAVAKATKQTEAFNKNDVELWQKKYTMWKAANREGNAS